MYTFTKRTIYYWGVPLITIPLHDWTIYFINANIDEIVFTTTTDLFYHRKLSSYIRINKSIAQ